MQMSALYLHQLAGPLGVSKDTLNALRLSHLSADEWELVQGQGYRITPDAEKKIRAALRAPAEVGEHFVITRTCANPRIVEGRPEAESAGTCVRIVLCHRQPLPPARGWHLRGCVWSPARGLWEFHGRASRR